MSGRDLPDRFETLRLLGKGGLAEVFLARDRERGGEEVAVKLIRRQYLQMPEVRQRFGREARVMARVDHPHLLAVHDFDLEVASPWLSMAVVRGEDLDKVIKAEAPFEAARAVRIAGEIAGALDALHAAGVIHRDLKPANVMLREDGHAVVMDLGLASLRDATVLTRTGQLLGTPRYFPPEILLGGTWDPRGDQYQLGSIAYEMLSGRRLIPGDDMNALVASLREGTRNPFSPGLGVPAVVRAAVDRAVAADPAERFASCGDFARALRGEIPAGGPGARSGVQLPVGDAPGGGAAPPRAGRRSLGLWVAAFVAVGYLAPWGGSPPEDVRFGVVGSSLVVEFRREDAAGVELLVDGVAVPVTPARRGDGWVLQAEVLEPGRDAEARLRWPGGEGEPFPATGEPPLLSGDVTLAGAGRVTLVARRPLEVVGAGGETRAFDEGPFPWEPPDPGASTWVVETREEGISRRFEFSRAEVLRAAFVRLEGAVADVEVGKLLGDVRRGRAGADAELERYWGAWEPVVRWLPAFFGGALDRWQAARLWRYWEVRRRVAAGRRRAGQVDPLEELPPTYVGASYLGSIRSETATATAVMVAAGRVGFREEGREIQVRTRSAAFGVASASAVATELTWPEVGSGETGTLHLSVRIRRLPSETFFRLAPRDPGDAGLVVTWVHPEVAPGADAESFRGERSPRWMTRVVPASLAPPAGTPMQMVLMGIEGNEMNTGWVGEDLRISWP